ncbi:MAG: hypothetical protein HZA90_10270 [Verrucomicrobia bacterium]|nr:hypothetical protein [Verrucomicrobiota bacterium]
MTFFTDEVTAEKPIGKPYGLALRHAKLYVCDTALNAIRVLDLEKRTMTVFAPEGEGRLHKPVNVAVDADGTRYVADTGRNQVLIYTSGGEFVGAIGPKPTNAPLEMVVPPTSPITTDDLAGWRPTDVLVAGNWLYVADLKNHLVRVYDKATRQPLFTVPKDTNAEPAKLLVPTNLALDAQGRLYVSDIGGCRVQQYDAEGNFLRSFGGIGDRPGEFARPKGVAVDQQGRLYVVDAAAQVVQIFDDQGRLLLYFGEPQSSAAALDLPAKVVIDYEHVPFFQKFAAPGFQLEYLVLVSNQYGQHKVSVFGFGQKR